MKTAVSELKARSKKQAVGIIQREDYYNGTYVKVNRIYYVR